MAARLDGSEFMKRWSAFIITVVLLGAALVASERQRIATPVGPEAVLSLIADTQHEITRLPVSFGRMSDADEIQIGNRLARVYLHEGLSSKATPHTRDVQIYINRVGARVAVGAQRKLPYQFHYVANSDFVNAFALPGGHVFIGGGLMAQMDSEDELASVLGHEVEHIDHYHCADRVQTEMALRKIPLGELVEIPVEVFEAGYSKNQELEADREGVRLAVKARYSPLGAVRMFQTFQRLFQEERGRARSPQEELSTVAWETLEGYFRSHPLPSERIAQIKTMISDEHWENLTSEQPLEVEYVFLTERAGRALISAKYGAAEAAAARSLRLHPDQNQALAILAQAQFALKEFPAALASYQQVLKESPPDAATVGDFANRIALDSLDHKKYADAATYASASLDLQPNNAPGLTILAEAQTALGYYAEAGATYQRLKNSYREGAESVVAYAGAIAHGALDSHRYQQAREAAAFWLTLLPNAKAALDVEARATLALGDFGAAAQAFRKLLDLTPKDVQVDVQQVWAYADALSAANLGEAGVNEFHSFMVADRNVQNGVLENQIRIEYAGLALMAGDSAPAHELASSSRGGRGSWIPPELMGRLGWWYYRAGKYSDAEALLRRLALVRPGDANLQNDLGWAELEQNELDAASRQFSSLGERRDLKFAQWNTPQMGLAIAQWRKHQADEALKNYKPAAEAEPRWTNPKLVRTFYSPQVAETVAELQSEQARRLEAQKRKAPAKP